MDGSGICGNRRNVPESGRAPVQQRQLSGLARPVKPCCEIDPPPVPTMGTAAFLVPAVRGRPPRLAVSRRAAPGGQIPGCLGRRGDRRQRAPVSGKGNRTQKAARADGFEIRICACQSAIRSAAYCAVPLRWRNEITSVPSATAYRATKGSNHSVVSPGQRS